MFQWFNHIWHLLSTYIYTKCFNVVAYEIYWDMYMYTVLVCRPIQGRFDQLSQARTQAYAHIRTGVRIFG